MSGRGPPQTHHLDPPRCRRPRCRPRPGRPRRRAPAAPRLSRNGAQHSHSAVIAAVSSPLSWGRNGPTMTRTPSVEPAPAPRPPPEHRPPSH